MNYLQTNTASQTLLLSLEEGVLLLPSFTDYLLVIQNEITLEIFAVIPTLISTNERITTLSISTNADNAVNGSILIVDGGRYNYVIYGQNSNSNLDPTDADVVGKIKRGYIEFTTLTQYFDQPSLTIPNDIEYNG
jgi:hypothetical protein